MQLSKIILFTAATVAMASASSLRQEARLLQDGETYGSPDDFQQQMLQRLNAERAKEGKGPLCINSKLKRAAQLHADDEAQNDYMDHTSPDNGSTMTSRIQATSYDYSKIAENVAAGQVDVEAVMDAWMKSPGHRKNIMGDYNQFGGGYAFNAKSQYSHYWAQDFGKSTAEECESGDDTYGKEADITPAPTDAPTDAPTEAPTEPPTQAPTPAATPAPTDAPTEAPTEPPTQAPAPAATPAPTEAPTMVPTESPASETPAAVHPDCDAH